MFLLHQFIFMGHFLLLCLLICFEFYVIQVDVCLITQNYLHVLFFFPLQRERVEQLLLESNSSHAIIVDNLKKVYPGKDGNPAKFAVRGLSLTLPQGECFGMLGPNGAGKTSFINMVSTNALFLFKLYTIQKILFHMFSPRRDHQGSISVPEIIWGIFHPIHEMCNAWGLFGCFCQ